MESSTLPDTYRQGVHRRYRRDHGQRDVTSSDIMATSCSVLPMTSTQTVNPIRRARLSLGMSQDDLVTVLREEYGIAEANKRSLQRWEGGFSQPSRRYSRVLAAVFGTTPGELGLPHAIPDEDGAHHVRAGMPFLEPPKAQGAPVSDGRLPGVWHSRYQYWSTGRKALYVSQYYVLLSQDGQNLTIDSLPIGVPPSIHLEADVKGNIITGRYDEHTDPAGHYMGDVRSGALQLIMTPDHRYAAGKWVGWGGGNVVSSGPWELIWLGADTSADALSRYSRALPDEPVR